MTTPWTYSGPVTSLARSDSSVTLVEGQTFCLSSRVGDFLADAPHGLFVLDTRVLSRWGLRVDGHPLEPLTVTLDSPFEATFVSRASPALGRADADLVVFRHRSIGGGMRERVIVRSYGTAPRPVVVELLCDADFAGLFAVKEGRVEPREGYHCTVGRASLAFGRDASGQRTEIEFSASALMEPGIATWRFTLDARAELELCVEVGVQLGGHDVPRRFRCGADGDESVPEQRMASWRGAVPTVESDSAALTSAVTRARDDLGALRIFDPEHPDLPVVAAGAPWFMTLFGRDSLITGWMSLIAEPNLALGVLETLARFQGTDVNPATEEEPGKILHEVRFGANGGLSLGGGHIYYGTIDATPLFVMLVGELRRWGLADDVVTRLLPHMDAALNWIETFGDRDGDGYVEYQRATPAGLANQGWKDCWDGVRFADGRFPQTPIALCEVQGYTYAAYIARAHFATRGRRRGHPSALHREGTPVEGGVQSGLLAGGQRLVRTRVGCRQATDRRARQQHGALPVDRYRRRREGRNRRRPVDVARSLQRLGDPNARNLHGARTTRSRTTADRSGPTTPRSAQPASFATG